MSAHTDNEWKALFGTAALTHLGQMTEAAEIIAEELRLAHRDKVTGHAEASLLRVRKAATWAGRLQRALRQLSANGGN